MANSSTPAGTNAPPPNIPPAALARAQTAGASLRNSGVTAAEPAAPSAPARQAPAQPAVPANLDAGTAAHISSAQSAPANTQGTSQTQMAYKQATETAAPARQQGVQMDH